MLDTGVPDAGTANAATPQACILQLGNRHLKWPVARPVSSYVLMVLLRAVPRGRSPLSVFWRTW